MTAIVLTVTAIVLTMTNTDGLPTTPKEAASAAMVEAAQSLEEREGIDYEGFDDPATQQSEACEGGLAGARAAALWHLSRDPTCRYEPVLVHLHLYKLTPHVPINP